ncbi:ribonuclease H-like domain-containing protein [Caldisericum exile]|uniref:ribonuclease H-like domain-containing protein n=1 Tax=Caldisericum exile TaxID=693075 RepID=UPI003C71132C
MNNWTSEEIKILEKHYPKIGIKVKMFLPHRTPESIEHKARRLGIKYNPLGEGKAGYLDIETTGLQGDFNYMLSWCIKTANKDEVKFGLVKSEEQVNGTLDKRITKELIEALKEYNVIYTFYGTRFDVAFLRTRALYHDIEFVPYGLIQHRDLYYLVRRILKIHRNRLENVADLLGIKGKTHLEPRIWIRANSGDSEALKYILEHNKADVILLEKVHKKLKNYEAQTRRYL